MSIKFLSILMGFLLSCSADKNDTAGGGIKVVDADGDGFISLMTAMTLMPTLFQGQQILMIQKPV